LVSFLLLLCTAHLATEVGSVRGNWGDRGFNFFPRLIMKPPPPVWAASAVIGQVASRLPVRGKIVTWGKASDILTKNGSGKVSGRPRRKESK